MGCDIHLFAEVCRDSGGYEALADGEFLMPPDYRLFAALAGVRSEPGFAPMVLPRGIPNDLSQYVADRYFVPVLDSGRAAEWQIGEHVTPEEAQKLVEGGKSHWLTNETTQPFTPSTGGHIAHPDWHSASWLTIDEVRQSLEHADYLLAEAPDEFQSLIEYVNALAARKDTTGRLLFWFDN